MTFPSAFLSAQAGHAKAVSEGGLPYLDAIQEFWFFAFGSTRLLTSRSPHSVLQRRFPEAALEFVSDGQMNFKADELQSGRFECGPGEVICQKNYPQTRVPWSIRRLMSSLLMVCFLFSSQNLGKWKIEEGWFL